MEAIGSDTDALEARVAAACEDALEQVSRLIPPSPVVAPQFVDFSTDAAARLGEVQRGARDFAANSFLTCDAETFWLGYPSPRASLQSPFWLLVSEQGARWLSSTPGSYWDTTTTCGTWYREVS